MKKKEFIAKQKTPFIFAVGRRKESVARVRLYKGKGNSLVNEKPIEQYFPGEIARVLYAQPFRTTQTEGKYWATVKVTGGGRSSQLDAVVHGISRALASSDSQEFKPILRKHGFLTRDARIRERRKVGTGGKARRKKQSPKR